MSGPIFRFLIAAPAIGATGYFGVLLMNHAFAIMQQFAMLMVILVGAWIALWIFGILWLQRRKNKTLSSIGEILGQAFGYTALFQAMVYLTLIFFAMGTAMGFGEAAEDATRFTFDFLFGSGYLSVFVYGGASATILFTDARTLWKVISGLCLPITVGLPLYLLIWQEPLLQDLATDSLKSALAAGIYYLFFSVLLMIPQIHAKGSQGSAADQYRQRKKQTEP